MKGLNVINCIYFSFKVTLHRFNNTHCKVKTTGAVGYGRSDMRLKGRRHV